MYLKLSLLIVSIFIYWSDARVNGKAKLIIDTDAGGDDAVAILLALAVPESIEVVAITCTYGNTLVENVEKNVLKTLTVGNRTDIPVYSGASKPLIREYAATGYFGKDGFGDFDFNGVIEISIDRSKHAALAMIDLVNQHPGEISIAVIGPTTNVALAASMDANFTRNVKRFHVMGSKPFEYDGRAEFNSGLDPESNAILLNSVTTLTKLITTGHIAAQYKVDKAWRTQVFGKIDDERVKFLNNAESLALTRDKWQAVDSFTIATIIWPDLITDSVEAHMIADTCSQRPDAMRLVRDEKINVQIVKEFDINKFLNRLKESFA